MVGHVQVRSGPVLWEFFGPCLPPGCNSDLKSLDSHWGSLRIVLGSDWVARRGDFSGILAVRPCGHAACFSAFAAVWPVLKTTEGKDESRQNVECLTGSWRPGTHVPIQPKARAASRGRAAAV